MCTEPLQCAFEELLEVGQQPALAVIYTTFLPHWKALDGGSLLSLCAGRGSETEMLPQMHRGRRRQYHPHGSKRPCAATPMTSSV